VIGFAALVAEVPALPLHEAGKYVAGAYAVLFVLVLVYVTIMAVRLSRIERELGELLELSARAPQDGALDVSRPQSRSAASAVHGGGASEVPSA
jgi:CcmD family protein